MWSIGLDTVINWQWHSLRIVWSPPAHHKIENDGCICPSCKHSISPPVCLMGSIKIKSNFRRKLYISLWLIPWSPGKMCLQTHLWIISETVSKHIANILVVSSWWMCCKYKPFCRSPPSLSDLNRSRSGNWSPQGPGTKPQVDYAGSWPVPRHYRGIGCWYQDLCCQEDTLPHNES